MKRLLWMLLVGYLGLVFFANRGLYFSHFDPVYWKDRYEHSQWKLPQSARGIGDDGLYLYQGYLLTKGADPTLLNAEVPPLGKYAIGTSIRLFGNGYLFGFITTSLIVLAVFLLANLLFHDTLWALAAALLVALDPIITSQFALTMLESMQLLFLLFAVLSTVLFMRKPSAFLAIACGLCIGFFSATKLPLFSPLLAAAVIWLMWKKTKRMAPILLFFLFALLAYLAPYVQYFQLGHGLTDWLGVQKWILNFYLHANLAPSVGSMTATMLIGKTQNLFTRAWEPVTEWSPVWPLLFLLLPFGCFRMWKNQAPGRTAVISLVGAVLLLNLIPFWTRYLTIVLPFIYLTAAFLLKTRAKLFTFVLFAMLLLANAWASFRILFPTPQSTVAQFAYDWKHGFFQDMYEQVTPENTRDINRKEFHRFGQKVFYDAQIERATIDVVRPATSRFRSPQPVTLHITYFTRNLGPFTQDTVLPVVRVDGRWRIAWEWKFLMDGLSESSLTQTSVTPAKRGSIIAQSGKVLVQDSPSVLVSVIPKEVDTAKEEKMLKFLEGVFDRRVAAVALHSRYVENSPPAGGPVPLGVVMRPLDANTYQKLISYRGIQLTPAPGRFTHANTPETPIGMIANTQFFECCSLLYTTTTYDGISGLEQQYNDTLKGRNGGSLVIKNSQGTVVRTILSVEKKDGGNVQL